MSNMWIHAALAIAQAPREGEELSSEQGEVTSQQGATATTASDDQSQAAPPQKNPWWLMPSFFAILIIIYFFMLRGPRKKQQEHSKMIAALKKNDRVRTIGGILGTVIDVRGDDITLKIDESNNTKIHVVPGAIATVLSDENK
jgi:preprotein translocase subunit YajC